MNWLECTINAGPALLNPICAVLDDLGVEGYQIEDEADFLTFLEENRAYWDEVDEALSASMRGVSRIKFYVEDEPASLSRFQRIEEKIRSAIPSNAAGTESSLSFSASKVADEDWNEKWKAFYKPFQIGRLIVKPEWEELPQTLADSEGPVLNINPGMSFGTGTHESTRMCLTLIERYSKAGDEVLDVGCGSGILSVSALLLGAKSAVGVDIDPIARDSSRENARLNQIPDEKYKLYVGDVLKDSHLLETLRGKKYDLIAANIVADVIVALSDLIPSLIKKGGIFLCSGILNEYAYKVEEKFEALRFEIISHEVDGGWSAYAVRVNG